MTENTWRVGLVILYLAIMYSYYFAYTHRTHWWTSLILGLGIFGAGLGVLLALINPGYLVPTANLPEGS